VRFAHFRGEYIAFSGVLSTRPATRVTGTFRLCRTSSDHLYYIEEGLFMRSNSIVFALIFVTATCIPVFCDQHNCSETYEFAIGLAEGFREDAAQGWVWIGFGLPIIGTFVGATIGWDGWCDDRWGPFGLIGLATGMFSSILAPMLFPARPEVVPEYISEDGRDCYLAAYRRGMKSRRAGQSIVGSLAGGSASLLMIGILYVAHCGFDFGSGFSFYLPIGWGGGPGW